MIQIRRKVFETNSSSIHSLIINKQDVMNKEFKPDEIIYLQGKEYDWSNLDGNDLLKSPLEKIEYLFACIVARLNIQNYYEEANKDKEEIENDKNFKLLAKVVEDFTGAILKPGNNLEASIDHNSWGVFDFLFDNKDELKEFIFNYKYYILITNDNCDNNELYPFAFDLDYLGRNKTDYETQKRYEKRMKLYNKKQKASPAYSGSDIEDAFKNEYEG